MTRFRSSTRPTTTRRKSDRTIPRSKRLKKANKRPQRSSRSWSDLVPSGEWTIYRSVIRLFRNSRLPFMVGGGFSWANYTGHWRNTKDIDLFIHPRDKDEAVRLLTQAGFEDYFKQRPYDRGWIYRGFKDGNIVDIIWSMANRRAAVDDDWFDRSRKITVRGEPLNILAPEDLLWCKMYVLQRDHSDWPDLLNLLDAVGSKLEWKPLLKRVGPDVGVLKALLSLFSWLVPSHASTLPTWLRRELELPTLKRVGRETERYRARLLDSRAWFASAQPINKPLEI